MTKTTRTQSACVGVATPRISRTKKALLEAGKRLLSHGGMGGASIDDIVREADVAKGSFYNHFSSREALAAEVLLTLQAELQVNIAVALEGVTDPVVQIARGLLVSFRYGLENQLSALAILHVTPEMAGVDQSSNSMLVQHLQAGMAQKAFKLERVDAGMVLVLGLSDLGLARLLDLKSEFYQSRVVMRSICQTLLRALGVDARRLDRVVDEALAVVIDAARTTNLRR